MAGVNTDLPLVFPELIGSQNMESVALLDMCNVATSQVTILLVNTCCVSNLDVLHYTCGTKCNVGLFLYFLMLFYFYQSLLVVVICSRRDRLEIELSTSLPKSVNLVLFR